MPLLAVIAACTAVSQGLELPDPAPLPQYSLGDAYQFTGRTSDRVVALHPDRIEWRNGADSFATTRNVLLPPLSWTTPTSYGSRHLDVGTETLFPLAVGQGAVFRATTTVHDRATGRVRTVRETWRCDVGDTDVVATGAGRFPVYRVACAMSGSDGEQLSRTLYYAPALGFYVRADMREAGGPARSVVLTDYTVGDPALSDRARRDRDRAVQAALTRDVSGEIVRWQDPGSASEGTVEPLRTVRSPRYGWCRDYQEQIGARAREYTLIGTACHSSRLGWQLLDVRTFTASAG